MRPSAHVQRGVTAQRTSRTAVHRSLAGQPVHKLPGGQLIVPLVGPDDNNTLPFAVALQLQVPQQHARHVSHYAASTSAAVAEGRDCAHAYQLHYVLEGRGKVHMDTPEGSVQQLQAGDTLLLPSSSNVYACEGSGAEVSGASSGPGSSRRVGGGLEAALPADCLASLVMLLPAESDADDGEAQGGAAAAGAHELVAAAWQTWTAAPCVAHLSQQALEAILAGRNQLPPGAAVVGEPRGLRGCGGAASDPALRHGLLMHAPPLLHALLRPLEAFLRWGRGVSEQGQYNDGRLVLYRALEDLDLFQLPGQTNCLAPVFEPLQYPVPFTFGVEIFQAGHHTPPHTHPNAHELFFILQGEGSAFCDGERFHVASGDMVLFPPKSLHGIDVGTESKMYCLEFMLPNEMFAEFVLTGQKRQLGNDDLCALNAIAC